MQLCWVIIIVLDVIFIHPTQQFLVHVLLVFQQNLCLWRSLYFLQDPSTGGYQLSPSK